MGQIPAHGCTVPNGMCSTRSQPIDGYVVTNELGLVTANSSSFRTQNAAQNQMHTQEAINILSQQAAALGANAVLGMHIDFKQLGERNAFSIVQVTGMACTVGPDPHRPPTSQAQQPPPQQPCSAAPLPPDHYAPSAPPPAGGAMAPPPVPPRQ
eukprot:TRINITY_DN112661_c0_g1_i1.p2 TRINITY_DN112661_c0_g1~~TRINITY_DN112661_c0_g1_i1.p2  ORF type:complete len:154 (-),score=14.62 TRINITY_DN112661_c0_g1_i1:66-527(-)